MEWHVDDSGYLKSCLNPHYGALKYTLISFGHGEVTILRMKEWNINKNNIKNYTKNEKKKKKKTERMLNLQSNMLISI